MNGSLQISEKLKYKIDGFETSFLQEIYSEVIEFAF